MASTAFADSFVTEFLMHVNLRNDLLLPTMLAIYPGVGTFPKMVFQMNEGQSYLTSLVYALNHSHLAFIFMFGFKILLNFSTAPLTIDIFV